MTKSFKDKMQQKAVNPTLQFISRADPEEEQPQRPTMRDEVQEIAEQQYKGKRTASSAPRKAPPARRALPQYEETKSRRLQLLLTPSLYEAVKDKAAGARLSVNEYINTVLKDATEK